MNRSHIARKAAIIGVGQSAIGRTPGRRSLDLMLEATDRALESAGLDVTAIDGLITLPSMTEHWLMPAAVVAQGLCLEPKFLTTINLTGAGGVAMIDQAAMAIAAGACETVLCVAAEPLLSGMTRDRAVSVMACSAANREGECYAGATVPSLYALIAARHMHVYGTTCEELASVAVQMRKHAALNANAHFRNPISLSDVLSSKVIATPLHLLDCAPVSDGGAAVIVVSAERARQLKTDSARLLGCGYGISNAYLTDAKDPLVTGAGMSGKTAFLNAGLTPRDMQFGCLYDCFTITLLMELESLGLCPRGESGAFVSSGGIDRSGSMPINANGGLLSGGHPGLPAGLLPVVEAARQIMKEAGAHQLPTVRRFLVW